MGATIKAYDPKAVEKAKTIFGDKIEFCNKKYDVLDDVNCLVIVTEWNELRSPNFKALNDRMKEKVIFDGRNLYFPDLIDKLGFEYYSIGS